jgi:hypothetical protein
MRQSSPADVQPLDVSTVDSYIPGRGHRVLGKLAIPMQHVITAVLSRARDPEPEISHASCQKAVESQAISWEWLPMLTLTSTLGVFVVGYAYNTARNGATGADIFFWFGLLLIFVPSVVRLLSPSALRFERISLLCVSGICLYLVKLMNSPFSFNGFDAMLHWRTADDIIRSRHLFTENTLLPASPFYPGLEIVTNAVVRLSGLNSFYAGTTVIGVARLVMILSLFILYEQITKSARIGGIATILYMANPHFLFFDAQFSYESLALPLATFALATTAYLETLKRDQRWMTFVVWVALGGVVVTHHMTSFVFDAFLVLWAALYTFQRPVRALLSNLAKTTLFTVLISFAWIGLRGNPVLVYLSSYFADAVEELGHVLTGTSQAQQLFATYAGQPLPIWQQVLSLSSLALILLSLPFGLLCFWQRYRYNALACMFGLVSLFYPISYLFRFTNSGAEITGRAAAFLFIPIAYVLSIFIAQFWPMRRLSWKQTSLITCAISVVFLGGTILGVGPPWEYLPGPYLVAADARSIEPEGIQAAIWARSYLGPNNQIATDRTNRLLMSTYGDQNIITALTDNIGVTWVFFSSSLGGNEVSSLRSAKVRYLVVDLRLSQALPSFGVYFEPGEPNTFSHTSPISLQALTKFDTIPKVNRVFDSGDIIIYDVGGLINAHEKP